MRQMRHDEARASLRFAHELAQHVFVALRWLAWEDANHEFTGETSKLGALSLQVSSCDKLVVQGHWAFALADYGAGRLETCVKHARHTVAMRPRLAGHCIVLAACLAELGELPEARNTLVAARALCPALVESRLAGICYFVGPGLTDCYVRALRLAHRGERPSAGAPGLHSGVAALHGPIPGQSDKVRAGGCEPGGRRAEQCRDRRAAGHQRPHGRTLYCRCAGPGGPAGPRDRGDPGGAARADPRRQTSCAFGNRRAGRSRWR